MCVAANTYKAECWREVVSIRDFQGTLPQFPTASASNIRGCSYRESYWKSILRLIYQSEILYHDNITTEWWFCAGDSFLRVELLRVLAWTESWLQKTLRWGPWDCRTGWGAAPASDGGRRIWLLRLAEKWRLSWQRGCGHAIVWTSLRLPSRSDQSGLWSPSILQRKGRRHGISCEHVWKRKTTWESTSWRAGGAT